MPENGVSYDDLLKDALMDKYLNK